MRSATGKAILLGVALATASLASCSSKDKSPIVTNDDPTSGNVGMELVLAPGVVVNTVSYHITGPGGFVRDGSVDVSNSSTISFGVGALPAGTGYTITLTATANDGGVNCAGSGNFDVIARSTTTVNVALTCQRPRNNGTVLVNGTVNICPVIDSFASTNAQNGVIQLSSSASDLDSAPSPLAYLWTVVSGPATLATAASANTALNCTGNGAVSLRLDVTDGDATVNCPDRITTSVTCSGVVASDGGSGAGAGGAGGAGGSAAGAGGSAAGAGGSAAGAGGSAAGAGGSAAGAGGTGGAGGGGVTTSSILTMKSAACLACAQTIDFDVFACGVNTQNCEVFTDGRKQLCLDTLACVIPSSCVDEATSNLAPCYCGTAIGAACLTAGNPNGVCRTAIETGLGSTNPTFIAGNTTNQMLGGGMAMALSQCLADAGCLSCF